MKREKQQEAMARLDGWESNGNWPNGNPIWKSKGFSVSGNEVVQLPNYHTDNEIDRMVRGLSEEIMWKYANHLGEIVLRDGGKWTHQATAEQKVEAYLKAKGVWA